MIKLIRIDDQFLAELKRADQLIDETVASKQDQLGMHNLLAGSIVALQQIIAQCEPDRPNP